MLTNLEVYSSNSSPPDLPLVLGSRGDTDPIHIRSIEGLGPVKANVGLRPYGSQDGEFHTGSTVGNRNIVMKVGFNPDWITHTVSKLRDSLYRYFMPKQTVRLRFFRDDAPTVEIEGVVEDCAPTIFAKDPEVQISVVCPLPDFVAVSQSVVQGIATDVPDSVDFTLLGNQPTPFIFESQAEEGEPAYDGTVKIEHRTLAPGEHHFEVTGVIDDETLLRLSTMRGEKTVQNILVLAPEEPINLLSTMTADSEWLALEPGTNKIKVFTETATDKPWTITYHERFGGL